MAYSRCAELAPTAGKTKWTFCCCAWEDDVTGGYSNGKIDGFIQGDIGDGVLHFTWRKGNANGQGVAEAQGESLRGTWGLAESEQGAGEFSAERQKKERTVP
jgi:hypothetical protein